MTLKILLVDDNLTFLASVKKTLTMLPATQVVGEAHDGLQALDLAERLLPDLVLMDIAMPHMSGLDAARIMHAWPVPPRVLFLTMHDNESYRAAANAMGALGLVGKANFVTELLPIIAGLVVAATEGTA